MQLLTTIHHCGKSEQELTQERILKARTRSSNHGGILLTDLLSCLHLATHT